MKVIGAVGVLPQRRVLSKFSKGPSSQKVSQGLFALLATVLLGSVAMAGDLFAPFSFDSATVLPKGVRSVRLQSFTTEIVDKYTQSGDVVSLGSGFNKSVSWQELVDVQEPGYERGRFKGGLRSYGVKMDDVAGYAHGVVNTRVTGNIPIFAYGLTEKITLGVAIPVIYSNVNVSTGWVATESFQVQIDRVGEAGHGAKIAANKDKLNNVVSAKLQANGYAIPENEQRTQLGDVTLGVKYLAYKGASLAIALAPKVVVPTGPTKDVNKLVDTSPGDGQWDLGMAGIVDYALTSDLTLTSSIGYTYQAPQSGKAMRIPRSVGESVTPDVDHSVREKLGDTITSGIGGQYNFTRLWSAGLGYHFSYKAPDKYSGGGYAPQRYEYLAHETEQSLEAVQLGLKFTTVPLYQSGEFLVPLEFSAVVSTVTQGRNVNKVSLAAIEAAAYF